MCEDSEYAYAQQLVASYFHMLTIGCQLTQCVNPQCISAAMLAAPSPTDAAIQSIYLARTAPIPICTPILAHFGLMEHDERGESGREECPETEDDDDALQDVATGSDTVMMLCSTPRRRLSSAVELALTFTNCSNSKESDDAEEDRWEQQQQKSSATRRLSLPKQKLLDALTRAFERTSSPTSTAKSSARGRES